VVASAVGVAADTVRRGRAELGHHRPLVAAVGRSAYPGADRLLITADGGGSNGYRTRLWKTELAPSPRRPA
jgi:DDE family transposase